MLSNSMVANWMAESSVSQAQDKNTFNEVMFKHSKVKPGCFVLYRSHNYWEEFE
jgi:hypothetical protein